MSFDVVECMGCHKFKDMGGETWYVPTEEVRQKFEKSRSDGYCPDCGKEYLDVVGKYRDNVRKPAD